MQHLCLHKDVREDSSNEWCEPAPTVIPEEGEADHNNNNGNNKTETMIIKITAGGYSYTRIGQLTGTDGLKDALGTGSIRVTFEKQI